MLGDPVCKLRVIFHQLVIPPLRAVGDSRYKQFLVMV